MIRALRRLLADRLLCWLLLGMPLVAMLLIWAIYSSGTPRELPIGLVQPAEQSASGPLASALLRNLAASPQLTVSQSFSDLTQASEAMQRGELYAVVALPRHLERDSLLGLSPTVTVYYNGQSILGGTLAAKAVQLAVSDLLAQHSISDAPVRLTLSALHNTRSHYVPFLVATALPALWQAAVMFATAWVGANHLSAGSNRAQRGWLLLALTCLCWLPGLTVLAGIYGWLGWPMSGSWAELLVSQLLLVLAAQGLALALVRLTGDLLRSFSLISGYCAPAFAFSGITFPTDSMPLLAQLWQQLMPVSHYLQLQIGYSGAGLSGLEQSDSWLALSLFLLAWPIAWLLRQADDTAEEDDEARESVSCQ